MVSQKPVLTIKIYKSANADIVVDVTLLRRLIETSLTRLDRTLAAAADMKRTFSKAETVGKSVCSACQQYADALRCF